jgi:nucleoside-diphosphate-sugar epimerase
MKAKMIVVAGAGGFIGGHLVGELIRKGHRNVRAVDIKPFEEWYQLFPDAHNIKSDLKE